jgi:hypothetical protein
LSQASARWLLGALLCVLGAQGCAGPRYVNNATARENTIKFAYTQQKFMATEQGFIECKVDQEGNLSECKKLDVDFKD